MNAHASTVRAMAQWVSKMDDRSAMLAFHHFIGAIEVQFEDKAATPERICSALHRSISAHSNIAPPLAEPGTPEAARMSAFYDRGTYTGD